MPKYFVLKLFKIVGYMSVSRDQRTCKEPERWIIWETNVCVGKKFHSHELFMSIRNSEKYFYSKIHNIKLFYSYVGYGCGFYKQREIKRKNLSPLGL